MDSKLKVLKHRQDDIFVSLSALLAAMASPVRLRLVHFLSQAPLTVEVLSQKVDESIANTSMHLRKMLAEGLVSVESLGQKRLYTLAPEVLEFWENFQDFAQELDPTLELATGEVYGEIDWKLDWEHTRKLIKAGEVTLLDVRPQDEVTLEAAHPHVLHIPQGELKAKLKDLAKKKNYLVFCRGRLCALSAFSVNYLRENGLKAHRLERSWNSLKNDLP